MRAAAALGALCIVSVTGVVLSQAGTMRAGLNHFSPGTPALAEEVNENFAQLYDWIVGKVGAVGTSGVQTSELTVTGNVTTGGALTVTGNVGTGGALTVTGNVTTGGDYLTTSINGQVEVSNDFAFRDTGDSWLRLRQGANSDVYSDLAVGNLSVGGVVSGLTATLTGCAWVADDIEAEGSIVYLDRQNNLNCPANKVMTQFDVANTGGFTYRMSYYCCFITVQ